MTPKYDEIVKWINEYFQTYSTVGQDPKTADRMEKYFAPEMRFIPFIAALGGPQGGFKGRDEFISKAKAHPSWFEKLSPIEIIVDEKKLEVAVLFGMQVMNRKTNEVAVKKSAFSHYELMVDEKNTLKIKTIRFFWEILPPGVPEFYDLFKGE